MEELSDEFEIDVDLEDFDEDAVGEGDLPEGRMAPHSRRLLTAGELNEALIKRFQETQEAALARPPRPKRLPEKSAPLPPRPFSYLTPRTTRRCL